ncbi:hypothetical protein HYR99_14380 [Candidatus Poribacteria bacterium]|nr:hypothetical protein [Candidatus Poribacteria bacterium]
MMSQRERKSLAQREPVQGDEIPSIGIDSIQVNYVREFTKLSLWYAHKRIREGESHFEDAINVRVNIYRNTSLYDGVRHPSHEEVGPEWAEILERLRAIFDRYMNEPSTARLEEEGLDLLWPYLRKHRNPPPPPESRPYECWSYDCRGDGVNIHIANLYQPRSPLSDMRIPFAASLIRLLCDVRAERPEIEIVRCGSWLNSVPPFQALFPASWKQSAHLSPEVRYTMGHWGQFTDRRGDFHARNGARFRETGAFPFPNLRCECRIEEALAHLTGNFPQVALDADEIGAVVYNAHRGDARGHEKTSPAK